MTRHSAKPGRHTHSAPSASRTGDHEGRRPPEHRPPEHRHNERPDMVSLTVLVPRDRAGQVKHYAQRISRNRPARRDDVLHQLRHHARDLQARFGIRSLALFGSVAHNESRRESDVDLLVEFLPGRPDGMLEFVALKGWLESLLDRPVDLITPDNIKPRIRDRILQEAIHVF